MTPEALRELTDEQLAAHAEHAADQLEAHNARASLAIEECEAGIRRADAPEVLRTHALSGWWGGMLYLAQRERFRRDGLDLDAEYRERGFDPAVAVRSFVNAVCYFNPWPKGAF